MQKSFPKIRKAVLPAAGFGTRLLPATKALPKELLPIVDKPVLQFLVEEAVSIGVEEIIFVINTGKEAIWNHFAPHKILEQMLAGKGKKQELAELKKIHQIAKFSYVLQAEPLGDGHAILQARELIGDEPFLVLFGDDLVVNKKSAAAQLAESYARNGGAVVALQEVPKNLVSNYGVVKPGKKNGREIAIQSFVEKPKPANAPSNLAIVGKYICPPEIFEILARRPKASGEMRLIDALAELKKRQPVTGVVFEGTRYDTGDKTGFVTAVIDFALRHPETKAAVAKHIKKIAAGLPKA